MTKLDRPKGNRRRRGALVGDSIGLLDRQIGGWGLLCCLALFLGLTLFWLMEAALIVVGDLQDAGSSEQGTGVVFGTVRAFGSLFALSLTATAIFSLYRSLQDSSQIKLRFFALGASFLAIFALAFFILSGSSLFYSSAATVLYFTVMAGCSLWAYAVNRSAKEYWQNH